jgi:hypothetical protein
MILIERRQTALITHVDNLMGNIHAWSRWALPVCLVYACSFGCGGGENIGVDLSADAPRFLIHRPILGSPFRWPRVTAFAIASEEDDAMWELRSTNPAGLPARHLAIIYGRVPPGFYQILPNDNATPAALRKGRLYYVGATGPEAAFRTVFSLPIDSLEASPAPPGELGANRSSRNRPNR